MHYLEHPLPSLPRLRGHHLICLHFYRGEGYNEAFIANLESVLERAEEYGVEVCRGTDDVCCACPSRDLNRCAHTEHAEEEIQAMDDRALHLLGVRHGQTVQWGAVRKRLSGLFSEWYAACCDGCNWKRACEKNDLYRDLSAKTA
ncbi:MAG: DUF1284 domain-containing protein [Nitrospirota bacterium]